ncbi:reverse transcriptase domain-containing protein, partial [Tanacetum coccineum]
THSSFSNLVPPSDPESGIRNRRRNLGDPSLLLDFEEINMNPNNVQGLPPAGPPPQNHNGPSGLNLQMPAPDLRMMEELCQSTMNGRGGPIALVNIQATDFGLKNYKIQQEMASKFISKYFPPSMVTKLRNDISNFRQLPDEYLFEAWERYKLSIDRCPNHNMLLVTQIDTFYNGLTLRHRDTINVAAGGTFMKRRPEECYDLIENMTAHHNDWDNSAHRLSPIFRSSELPPSPSTSFVIPERNPHQPLILYPSRLNGEKLQDNLAEALALMPKYAKMLKDLLSDKEKLLGLANTSLTENCSAVLLKKLLEKLRDPGKFLIPCDFPELEKCMALADLGASINLMPLSVWKKLMLPELILTRMTLKLANRSVAYPAGIAEDVCVQVGKFTFPADFIVVDYDIDPRVPLILGRPFLRTARALVDVYGEELILRVGDEKLIFHADNTSKYPHKHGNESINMINFIDITFKDHFNEVLKTQKSIHHFSGSTTSPSNSFPSLTSSETSDSSLQEFADELTLLEPIPPRNEDDNFDPEADLKEIKYLLNRDPSTDSSPKTNIDIIDPILERFTDELALVYSFPSEDDDVDLFVFESDNEEWKKLLYGDLFDNTHSENEKYQDLKMEFLIDDMDDYFLPLLPTSDSTLPEESYKSSKIVALLSSPFENEDKVFNPGILILGGT